MAADSKFAHSMLLRHRWRPALAGLLATLLTISGCGERSTSYFPLTKGWRWRYDIDVVTMDGPQKRVFIVENLGPADLDGQRVFVRGSAGGTYTYYREDDTGVMRLGETQPESPTQLYAAPRMVLPRQPDPSTRAWTDTEYTVALEHTGPPEHSLNRITVSVPMRYVVDSTNDEVMVPAGHFTGCLRIKGRGSTSKNVGFYVGQTDIVIENTEWYAPGVGLVRAERKETTTSKVLPHGYYEMRLTSLTRD